MTRTCTLTTTLPLTTALHPNMLMPIRLTIFIRRTALHVVLQAKHQHRTIKPTLHIYLHLFLSIPCQTSTQNHKTKSLRYKQPTLTNFIRTIPTLHIYLHRFSSIRSTYQSQATSSHHILPYLFGLHFGTTHKTLHFGKGIDFVEVRLVTSYGLCSSMSYLQILIL